jgi:biotin-(acetyl-CoA carboxylase) ligase
MGALYARTKKEGCGFITALWKTRWEDQGRMLTCNGITGVAEGLGADGALLLRTADGLLVRVMSGEASPPVPHA